MTTTPTDEPRTPYGWCLDGLHDKGAERGACPVQVGALLPCSCSCHGGATEARGYLGSESVAASPPSSAPEDDAPANANGGASEGPENLPAAAGQASGEDSLF